jgi:hypothetical protein
MGAVQNAMQRDGLDPSTLSLDPEKSLAFQLENKEASIDKGTPLKDDPTYSKYFKMLKMVRLYNEPDSASFTLLVHPHNNISRDCRWGLSKMPCSAMGLILL